MNEQRLRQMLYELQNNNIDLDTAVNKIKTFPYEDIDFAKLDHHRILRKGFSEVIFCQGKSREHVVEIVKKLNGSGAGVLGTRASRDVYEAVHEELPGIDIEYSELARTLVINGKKVVSEKGNILVMSAGTADLSVAEEAAVSAEFLGNKVQRMYDVGVAGIHRLLDKLEVIQQAQVIIAAAGMDGALASVVGGLVGQPVIAVPTSIGYGASFNGLSALLSMLNSCASGVSVVNIDNGFGAAAMANSITQLAAAKDKYY
ncbi:MAG: nickel pincer cofactor biosynthesis protein LarB [Clostridiales bacterium]|nr:nickel pincer cofactor biosynthesis protein LarB [Clostridiales bacterium]MCF8022240.1 nickel pincer cofactor biosynthesis protein LarB [Clostridiales bacterium]